MQQSKEAGWRSTAKPGGDLSSGSSLEGSNHRPQSSWRKKEWLIVSVNAVNSATQTKGRLCRFPEPDAEKALPVPTCHVHVNNTYSLRISFPHNSPSTVTTSWLSETHSMHVILLQSAHKCLNLFSFETNFSLIFSVVGLYCIFKQNVSFAFHFLSLICY